jgi:transposase
MTTTHSIAPTLLVAIDISKHRHEVLIGVPGRTRRRRLTVMNTLEDFKRLSAALVGYDLPVRIGFEATGNYHRTLAHHLGRAGFDLKLVSSVALARTREALHNSWDKNDPKDAQVILHMLEIGAVQFFHDPIVVGTADIQELSKTHEIVSRSKTELWHRILTHYLPLYFPEAERFHRSARTDWVLAFLEKYPSPHMISAMGRGAFIADAWDVVGRKVSKEQFFQMFMRRPLVRFDFQSTRTPTRSACSASCSPRVGALSASVTRLKLEPSNSSPTCPTISC